MKFLQPLSAILVLSACATQVENRASDDYAPVFQAPEAVTSNAPTTGAIYNPSRQGLFATDQRATQVGDILTVEFTERFNATKSQAANSAKTDNYDVDLPDLLTGGAEEGLLSGGTAQDFAGSGSATQSNSLTGRMSVHVVRILSGGTLEILGQKKMTLNNGDEYIRLSGIVRPEDISSGNIVLSERIANAEIKYVGAGDVADTAKKGWFRRAFSTLSPS